MRTKYGFFLAVFTLFFSLYSYAESEKMIFAVDVIRHGDRTPVHDLPTTPYTWPQGLGQLTPRGMQQEFQLGVNMRKNYVEEAQLLPANYQKETLYVRSTDFDRTLMSANSLLLGLYPQGTGPSLSDTEEPALPHAYQPIPIHTVPQKDDHLLLQEDKDPAQFQKWLQRYVFTRADWRKKTAELAPQFARFSQLTGIKITNLNQLISIGDALYIRKLYQLPLPKDMTEQEADTIIEAAHFAFVTQFKALKMGQVTGRRLLSTIVNYLVAASKHQSSLKFVLFSSHDSTILSLMSAMRVPLEAPPRYASDLNIALFEQGGGGYVVKVALNGEPVSLPACGGATCKLDQFVSLIR